MTKRQFCERAYFRACSLPTSGFSSSALASDRTGVAAFKIPEVVQVAVREDDEAAILRAGIFSGLLFTDQRILVLCLCFENDKREAPRVQQQEVDVALGGLLEVVA